MSSSAEIEQMREQSQREMRGANIEKSPLLDDQFQNAPAPLIGEENTENYTQIQSNSDTDNEKKHYQLENTNINTKKSSSGIDEEVERLRKMRAEMSINEPIAEERENGFQTQNSSPNTKEEHQLPPPQLNDSEPKSQDEQSHNAYHETHSNSEIQQRPQIQERQNIMSIIKNNSLVFFVIATIMIFINLPWIADVIAHVFKSIGLQPTFMNIVVSKSLLGATLFLLIHKLSIE